jgi:hypothetical protein
VGDTRERDEARRGQHGFVDRRVRILLLVAEEPAGRDPLVPAGILAGDEHGQLERVEQVKLRKVFRRGQGGEDVPALQRPLEDRVRMALRGRRSSSLGAAAGLTTLVGLRGFDPAAGPLNAWHIRGNPEASRLNRGTYLEVTVEHSVSR